MGLNLNSSMVALTSSHKLFPSAFTHVPYVSLINDTTVRLRDNGAMQCVRIEGVNAWTAGEREIDALSDALAGLLGQLSAQYTIYVHKIGRRLNPASEYPAIEGYGLASAVDRLWQSHLSDIGLRDKSLTISIVHHGDMQNRVPFLKKLTGGRLEKDDARRIAGLDEVVRFLRAGLGGDKSKILSARSGKLLGFLNSIMTGRERSVTPALGLSLIADDVVTERVTFSEQSIELDEGNLGKRFADIRALKSYSEESWATMFDELVMPCDYVITHSFSPVGANKAVDAIARQRQVMNSTSDVRRSAAEQLEIAHEQAMNRSLSLGEHQATVMLIDGDLSRLRECVSELENVAQQSGTTLVSDKFMRPAHFYAQLPGNQASYRVRTSLVTNYNMAGFASLHRSDLGITADELPWKAPLTAFPTLDGSAQLVSFHERGDPKSSPTPGHTVVIGKTGTGKSVLAGFLMAQAVRLDARVFVFDYRNGLEMVTRGLRGSYSYVNAGEATGLNPLQVETDEEGVSWLADWLSRILTPDGALQPVQAKRLFEVCETNARAPADLQVWSEFQQQFNLTDDEGDLRSLIEEWGPKGRFGWVFGQSQKDTFSLEGNVVGFDLTQILDADSDRERMAVLSYIFRRLERKLRDGRRTIVIIDEAWKAVDNPYFAERIKSWLVTLRKLNAVVVMLTQNPAQLTNSRVGSEIYSSFSNQILLPNPTADPEDFIPLHLNEKELSFVLGSRFGRAFLWRNEESSTVLRGDLSALGNLVHIIGGGAAGESVVGEQWRTNPEFWKKGLQK